jgi:dTDP-4-dehydrorhamnose reductase
MKIVATGAQGFLGRCLLGSSDECIWEGWSRQQGTVAGIVCKVVDLLDPETVVRLLAETRPDWVINTAAVTNVDSCEVDRAAARRANVDVVANLVAACRQTGVGLAHLSTDYVFDGEAGPYKEGDATRPLSHYGELKLESEELVLQKLERAFVVRTMWLYGYVPGARPNMVTWPLETLARGEEMRIVADQWGNPTYGPDLASALIGLCASEAAGLWHMGGGSFMTRYEQVVELATFFGFDAGQIQQTTTAALAQPARRPLRSGLSTEAIERHLGCKPLSFRQSLEHLVQDPYFCRDYGHLIS